MKLRDDLWEQLCEMFCQGEMFKARWTVMSNGLLLLVRRIVLEPRLDNLVFSCVDYFLEEEKKMIT